MKKVTIVGGEETYYVAYEHLSGNISLKDDIIGQYMFYNLHLTELILPDNIASIGDAAFERNDFENIELPETVVSITGSRNFRSCVKLEEIKLPSKLEELPNECFAGCASLAKVELPEKLVRIGHSAFAECGSLTSIAFPEGLETIGREGFARSGLLSVTIPENVREVMTSGNYEEGAFKSCQSLQTVRILSKYIDRLPAYTFKGCAALISITMPDQIDIIEQGAFTGCSSLEEINLPPNLESIYTEAFSDCTSLSAVQSSGSLRTIASRAFANTGFTTISLPEGLQRIDKLAFADCANLQSARVPSGVVEVKGGVFAHCYKLHSIFWDTSATFPTVYESTWYNDDIKGGNPNCLLYLKDETTQISDKNWKNIILNNVASQIVLTSGRGDFYCPQEFKALRISYTRDFSAKTYPHESAGWKSISLPFAVTRVEHEDGRVLAPFNSGVEGSKPFWLRRLKASGFEDVTTIEANTPYVIAMPNNERYAAEYNISGKVTFSAENYSEGITIPVTPALPQDEGPKFRLCANYQYKDKSVSVYVLNDKDSRDYHAGSVFEHSERAALPFEAYVANKVASAAAPAMYATGGNSQTKGLHEVGSEPNIKDM
ncbi:leucine-rich repeat domain-containing protein [Bacteroides stercorirosoris]|nr:leucine-rich repeat domain-containing protein [Bacteroides stercorirosoris]